MFNYSYAAAFLAVGRLGSLTKAAEELNIAQSAVSRQISLLEESVGEDLFLRGTRGVTLTNKGQELFEQLSKFNVWFSKQFYEENKSLTIGGMEGALNWWLGEKLIKATQNSFPFELKLIPMSSDRIQTALEKREIDLGLSTLKIESEFITSRKVYSEKISIVSNHSVDMKNLEKYRWIGVSKSEYAKRLLKNKKPQGVIQAGSFELLFKLVKAGLGIAAVPNNLIFDNRLIVTPTSLVGDLMYLNLPSYKKLPEHLNKFIKNVIDSDRF